MNHLTTYQRNTKKTFSATKPNTGVSKSVAKDPNALIKKFIWAYFILLIFEGALRKWVLPGLSTPLLVIRDPIAIAAIILALQKGLIPSNIYLNTMFGIGVLATMTTMVFGHGNIFVDLFGARTFLVHFPFIFVVGSVFNRDDIVKIGKVTLWIIIPIAILVALQFYSPQSSLVNRGVGGNEEGAGFTGTMGYYRPSGTFSFTNGIGLMYGFASCFVFYFWLAKNEINKIILLIATGSLLIVIPLSISRGLFFSIAVTFLFMILASARKPKFLTQIIVALLGGVFVILLLSQFSFFDTAKEVFLARFTNANESEGGLEGVLVDRYLGGLIGALTGNDKIPFFGMGLGFSSNVGSQLLSGKVVSGTGEGEWGRIIGEMGALIGIMVIIVRLAFSFNVALSSYKKLSKGDILPWLLLSFFLLNIPQGNWAQPTALGFCVIIAGFLLASLNDPKSVIRHTRASDNNNIKAPVRKLSTFGRIR